MHYDFFDFQHTLSDEERQLLLRDTYEHILKKVSEGSGRNVNKILKYLRESDFYAIPCRHHAFVGGNAWHQLETLVYAYGEEVGQSCDDFDLSDLSVKPKEKTREDIIAEAEAAAFAEAEG